MHVFLEAHFAVTTVLYPLANIVILILLVIGIIRTRLKKPFIMLALATILLLVPQGMTLLCFMKKSLDLGFPPPPIIRAVFPVQAIAEYLSFPLHIVGLALLIRVLIEEHSSRTPVVMEKGSARAL